MRFAPASFVFRSRVQKFQSRCDSFSHANVPPCVYKTEIVRLEKASKIECHPFQPDAKRCFLNLSFHDRAPHTFTVIYIILYTHRTRGKKSFNHFRIIFRLKIGTSTPVSMQLHIYVYIYIKLCQRPLYSKQTK